MSKILIADDDPNLRKYCYDLFAKDGHQVLLAAGGDQALTMIKAENPDLVLLDYQMPGRDGLSVLKELKKGKEAAVPVVIFSGFVSADLEKEAYAAGAIEVIGKGLGASDLQKQIYKILETKHRVLKTSVRPQEDKIMVVDDELVIRQFLVDFFTGKGIATVAAKSGEEGVSLFQKEKPNMILLDMTMPGMNGIETLKKIREIDSEVGVVMATAIQDETVIQQALDLGAYAYVLKPFDLQYLNLVVMTRLTLSA